MPGAQQEFIITDKYKKKRTLRNWGKPCIWLSNEDPRNETTSQVTKDWLTANCIFVNLEHRLYLPEPVVPPLFAPRPAVPATPLFLPSPSPPVENPPPVPTPLSYSDTPVPGNRFPNHHFTPVTINSQTVYLEDLM